LRSSFSGQMRPPRRRRMRCESSTTSCFAS
jgi:hypothetical protein